VRLPNLPTEERLAYWKLLAEVLLLALIVPLVFWAVFRDPRSASERALGKAPTP
jgi:hypothetical protein